jgi:syntaxin-binding protein 1
MDKQVLIFKQDLVTAKLDTTVFPYVKESATAATPGAPKPGGAPAAGPVSLRSKPQWTKSGKPTGPNETHQRVLVFVAGGMTYSEMRTAYESSRQLGKEVFIGAVSFLKGFFILKILTRH